MITPQELLSLGFKHNTGDDSYSLSITDKLHIEVQDDKTYIIMLNKGQGEIVWENLPNINDRERLKGLIWMFGPFMEILNVSDSQKLKSIEYNPYGPVVVDLTGLDDKK